MLLRELQQKACSLLPTDALCTLPLFIVIGTVPVWHCCPGHTASPAANAVHGLLE